MQRQILLGWLAMASALLLATAPVHGNGGPIFRPAPNPPAAPKGAMAPVLPGLQPGREARLEVVKEELRMQFTIAELQRPLVKVSAVYTIKNPTREDIGLDLGFPILGTSAGLSTRVQAGEREVESRLLSTSEIQASLREQARHVIEARLAEDAELRRMVGEARARKGKDPGTSRDPLITYLAEKRDFSQRDATLLWGHALLAPASRDPAGDSHPFDVDLAERALGPLKATQYLTLLASRFEPKTDLSYETLYSAWGGDVRERAVDLATGAIRPQRQAPPPEAEDLRTRLDYLDHEGMSPAELRACEAILQQLPVTFSFAPMTLIRTSLPFPAGTTQTVTFSYDQWAYTDTSDPASFQLGYVVHPASFWDKFGPIHLRVLVPKGVSLRASVPTRAQAGAGAPAGFVEHEGVVEHKTGHLYVAVPAHEWRTAAEWSRFIDRSPRSSRKASPAPK
jgi:hypothetical protein